MRETLLEKYFKYYICGVVIENDGRGINEGETLLFKKKMYEWLYVRSGVVVDIDKWRGKLKILN